MTTTPDLIRSQYVLDLLQLADDAISSARSGAQRLAEEVELRLPPNVHRYELLARNQYIAALAHLTVGELEDARTGPAWTALDATRAIVASYRTVHGNGLDERPLANLDLAIARVVLTVERTAEQEEAEAEHDAEQDRRIAEHEADLAQRDLL